MQRHPSFEHFRDVSLEAFRGEQREVAELLRSRHAAADTDLEGWRLGLGWVERREGGEGGKVRMKVQQGNAR